jgi:hypothetical protein
MADTTEKEFISRVLYLRLLGFVSPYKKVFALSLLCMAVSSAMEPA